jgi:hypothetical protein
LLVIFAEAVRSAFSDKKINASEALPWAVSESRRGAIFGLGPACAFEICGMRTKTTEAQMERSTLLRTSNFCLLYRKKEFFTYEAETGRW